MSFNKIILVGNLGRDPELRYTSKGDPVASFSLATNARKGADKEVTTWFRVTVWGKQAESVSKYLTKGRQVYVEGTLAQDEYTDKDGNKRTTLEVNANAVQFLGGGQGNDAAKAASAGAAPAAAPKADDSDIPF